MRKLIAVSAMALAAAACTTTDPYTGQEKTSNTARGAAIGGVVGAVAGALTNTSDGKQTTRNAALGAAAGAAIGGGVGNYMDRQEAELRADLETSGVRVVRNGNNIDLIMPGSITFGVDQADIRPAFYDTLNDISTVLQKYNQTTILVEGHTDSTGADQYNLDLSIRRAESVGNYLAAQGVDVPRIRALGYGETRPVADNSTEAGRQQNRRVEVRIAPAQS
ncbi:cell envelope biogenesis protein OmpA [Aquisalinus flavus]|uniref:Cell envelope biogenesis protein OmpA n=1 Tax=Aquisalinus flavus TaxID=1526572 RepID=A0A8J2V6V0_9PROT|nr:OmpA family protein [Aquisalinus flavus]MBD0428097.1 OmpA family protein [Aquisalinus flavus]GGD18687.1 cell envelope biogenesis protein OmpA [Aquisalinus flavus]